MIESLKTIKAISIESDPFDVVVVDGVKLEIKYFYAKGDLSAVPKVVSIIPKV